MSECEGSACRADRTGSGKTQSASTENPAEILAPAETDGQGLLSSLQDNGIAFWVYCTASCRSFLLGPDGIVPGIAGDAFHPEGGSLVEEDHGILASALEAMEKLGESREVRFRVKDEAGAIRWLRCTGSRLPGTNPIRLGGLVIDITGEVEAVEMQALIASELQHRLHNLFAVFSAMVRSLARQFNDASSYANELENRLGSLAKAHDLLWASESHPMLGNLLEAILAPYRDLAILELTGPTVSILPGALTPLTLILHEWVTNSVKYGCLRGLSEARLTIYWETSDSELRILWVEDIPGPIADNQRGSGFGSRLLEALVKQIDARFERRIFPGQTALSLAMPLRLFTAA